MQMNEYANEIDAVKSKYPQTGQGVVPTKNIGLSLKTCFDMDNDEEYSS